MRRAAMSPVVLVLLKTKLASAAFGKLACALARLSLKVWHPVKVRYVRLTSGASELNVPVIVLQCSQYSATSSSPVSGDSKSSEPVKSLAQ